jgi:son of sevenless
MFDLSLSHARWLAPEYNKSAGVVFHFPTEKADVWSFGLLCLEVFTGEDPYNSHSDLAAHALLRKGIIPEYPGSTAGGLSPHMWEITQCCWRVDPDERPSISEIKLVIYALIPPHPREWFFVSHHQGPYLPLSGV